MPYMYSTGDATNVSRQIIYTSMLQRRFKAWLLGQRLMNDRTSEFPDGDVAYFDQVGQRSLKSRVENAEVDFSKLDTSRIELRVTDQYQDGFAMTDEMKEDSYKAAMFWATNIEESMDAFDRQLEADILATCNQQALADTNTIAGYNHRMFSTGDSNAFSLDDIRYMKLAFDKARVPTQGRVLLVDPSVEYQLNGQLGITSNINDGNNTLTGLLNTGFGDGLEFMGKFYGFNVIISHELPTIASETIGSDTVTNGVCNIAMSIASSDATPFMGVIRRPPKAGFFRNETRKRDEWSATSRWGFALQRPESLGVIISAA